MRNPWGTCAVAAIVAALPAIPSAQAKPVYDPAVDVQLFQWAIGPSTFFTVADTDVAEHEQLVADGVVTLATRPFVLANATPGHDEPVVRSVTAAQLAVAYGLFDRFQIGVALPVILDLQGDAFDAQTNAPASGGLTVHGIGDLRIELKARLWHHRHFRVGAIVGGTLATSAGTENSQFTGDQTASARGKVTLEWDRDRLTLGANGGVILREQRFVYGVEVGDELVWGAAAAVRVTDRLSVVAEALGETGIAAFDREQSPLEVVGGFRIHVTPSISVVVGGGAGVRPGLGSPQSQVFLALGYAPDNRDSDGDGIPNARDKCPLVAEDKDGFQDEDGCPDDDNDGDRHPDATDKCPNAAEDMDGFQDEDGCPDLDNDQDGIPDVDDKCPDVPEDGLPPFPHDGCPYVKPSPEDTDSDNDGISDAADKCPLCPEDKDGFQDEDGCPDLDNDNDGIADANDKCPNEPETVNGVEDEDGCPDTGGLEVVRLDGDTLVVDRAPTLEGAVLSRAGALIVQQMALVMGGHHEISKWLIAVAQPTAAGAKQLGAVLKAELVRRGVTAELTVLDKAGPSKVAGAVEERTDPRAAACPTRAPAPGAAPAESPSP